MSAGRRRLASALSVLALALGLMALVPLLASASRSFLYYQDGAWIDRVALTPKHRPVHVIDTKSGPLAIAVAGSHVFWTDESDDAAGFGSSIMEADADGRHVRTLVSGLPITISLAAAHGYVYWPDEDGIGRVAVDGTHQDRSYIPLPPENGGGVADGLAITGSHLFFSRCQDGTVGRVDLDGHSIRQNLVSLGWPNCPQALATDGGRVYWAELGEAGESYGRIGSATRGGGDIEEASLVINSEDGPFGIAAGGGSMFWAWGGATGSPEYVARSQIHGLKVNSKFVTGGSAIALMVGSRRGGTG